MLHITHEPKSRPHPATPPVQPVQFARSPIEDIQLARLAGAVLEKSPEDLMAIAESNPMLIWEWIEAFRDRRHKAELEARYWAAAMATLSTAIPEALRTAAE